MSDEGRAAETPKTPQWKFWHPLPTWLALLIFVAAQLVVTFLIVALQELAGIRIPQWVAGGVAGLVGYLVVMSLVVKKRTALSRSPTKAP